VTFIWSRGTWSVGKALFVPTRYIPFVIIPLTVFVTPHQTGEKSQATLCFRLVRHCYTSSLVGCVSIGLIFGLRAYAMWNRNRAVLVTYCCVTTVHNPLLEVLCFSVDFCHSGHYGESPIAIIPGCYETGGSSIDFAIFVVIMATEAVTTTLTVYRAYRHFRQTPNALAQNMTRDGVFYCVTMFASSIRKFTIFLGCCIYILHVCYVAHTSTPRYQAIMHTVLATRMQLHLRKVDQHTYLMDRFAEESLAPMSFMRSTFLSDIG
ncbi:hypothetical protein PAXINDRAFT_81950, partial [Paxillus involutus ATCC 200175]